MDQAILSKQKSALPAVLVMFVVVGSLFATYFFIDQKTPKYRPYILPAKVMRAVTVTGEVVDAWCYASQTMGPGRGPGHKACAIACISGGITPGILEDKTLNLYIAAKSQGYKGCQELLLPYVGDKVTVTGFVGELGGCRVLRVQTVTPFKKSEDPALQ